MKPFLFIAGAPRSGTTFLAEQLGSSPEVVLCKGRASYYFMDKEHPLLHSKNNYHQGGIEGFSNIFPNQSGKYYLDGTDHLMYQSSMIDVISQLPKKKIIFIFREPAARIYSSFHYTKNNLGNFRKDISFKTYVDALLQGDKKKIQSWLHSNERSGFVLANELDYSHYYNYIIKWKEALGGNLIFFLFEEMIEQKELFFLKLLEQLGLNYFEINNENKNESYEIKNKKLHHKIMSWSQTIPASSLKNWGKNIYLKFQKKENEISEEDILALEQLKKEFVLSNKQLANIIQRDLSLWK